LLPTSHGVIDPRAPSGSLGPSRHLAIHHGRHRWPFAPPSMRRRTLLRWVQIALKPASKTLGLHGVVIRCKGLKYVIADSAFKRMQVDARACWLDTDKHRGVSLRFWISQERQGWSHGLNLSISAAISSSVAFSAATNSWARPRRKSRSAVSISPATKSSGTPSIAAS